LCQNKKGKVKNDPELERLTHKTVKKVTEDIENLRYNTAIAALMEYVNNLTTNYKLLVTAKELEALLLLLAPLAPHITEELWQEALGHETSIHNEKWPEYDLEKIKEERVHMAVQINGKVRSQIEVDADAQEDDMKELALGDEKIKKWLEGKTPKKIIVVPNRVVNIVI